MQDGSLVTELGQCEQYGGTIYLTQPEWRADCCPKMLGAALRKETRGRRASGVPQRCISVSQSIPFGISSGL